ncbi:unnamed protein product [Durusdinium trenchii]|uniref:Uncharacterized protein n=1 Tax=Durusdinium trenchii TaxID=1381693 RepID=A0ABP0S3L3_9DINO
MQLIRWPTSLLARLSCSFLAGYLLSFMNGDEKQPDSRREPILKIQDRSKIDPDVLTILAMAQTSCV